MAIDTRILGSWQICDIINNVGESIADQANIMLGVVYKFKEKGALEITFWNGALADGKYSIINVGQRNYISFKPSAKKERSEIVMHSEKKFDLISDAIILQFIRQF